MSLDERRTNRITSSRIGAVLGHNPYLSRTGVMREMLLERAGKRIGNVSRDTLRGNALEPQGIAFAEREFGALQKGRFGIHKRFDFLGATPDAIGNGFVVEVKAPRDMYFSIPQRYFDQMQLQMAVFESKFCVFVQVVGNEFDWCKCERDFAFIDKNMDSLQSFMSELEYAQKHEQDFILQSYALELSELRAQQKALAEKESAVKGAILERLEGKSFASEFLSVSQKSGATRIDYKRFCADRGLEIPQDYISKGEATWQILPKKEQTEASRFRFA